MRIRLATADDAEAVASIYRPVVEATAISFEAVAPDAQEMRQRILDTLATHPWLVFEEGPQVLGYAYASRHRVRAAYRWSVDTSVYVSASARRRGIGLALYSSLLAILKAQRFANAYAGIALPNPASMALHEQVGFVPVGVYRNVGYKHGRWHDVGWWQRPLDEAVTTPSEPLSLAAAIHGKPGSALVSLGLPYVRLGTAG